MQFGWSELKIKLNNKVWTYAPLKFGQVKEKSNKPEMAFRLQSHQ